MKTTVVLTLFILITVSICHQKLRKHETPFLDSISSLGTAQLMSADYSAVLPSSIQPGLMKIMGYEQNSISNLFHKASGSLIGSQSSDQDKILGETGDQLKSAGGSSGNGIFSQFSNAFGGAGEKSGSSSALSGLSNLIPGGSGSGSSSSSGSGSGSGFSNIFSGILPS